MPERVLKMGENAVAKRLGMPGNGSGKAQAGAVTKPGKAVTRLIKAQDVDDEFEDAWAALG